MRRHTQLDSTPSRSPSPSASSSSASPPARSPVTRAVSLQAASTTLSKPLRKMSTDLRRKASRLGISKKRGTTRRPMSYQPQEMNSHDLQEEHARAEEAQKQYELEKTTFVATAERKRKVFFADKSVSAKEQLTRKGRGRNKLLAALSKSPERYGGFDDLFGDEDDDNSCFDQYSIAWDKPPFHTLTKFNKEYNSDTRIRSPFVSSTYRRASERDDEWISTQRGAEYRPKSSAEDSPAANYATSISMSFQSLGDSFSLGCESGVFDDIDEEGESYDDFENPTPKKDFTAISEKEEKKFLENMAASFFSYQDDHPDSDSITLCESSDSEEYDGVPKDENYFGEVARTNFFALYQRLARKGLRNCAPAPPVLSAKAVQRRASMHPSLHSSRRPSHSRLETCRSKDRTLKALGSPKPDKTQSNDLDGLELALENLSAEIADRPLSPRHRFLMKLIGDSKVPPLPIIIRHNKENDELNLAHRALGDDYIIYLSAVVKDLPYLKKVNLRDNRLTDRGMGVFIHALAEQDRVVDVDISENKIDSASADALTHYLRDPHCTLRKLRMSNADLDDDEIAIFMNALEVNTSIVEMDVSHNLLGGRGETSTKGIKDTKSQQLTGGAAVAAALRHNGTLLHLNLSWNKLGLASARHLGLALSINSSLISINLAFNTIRDEGAELIGMSLAANSTLRSLNLSSNGIGPQGTIVIATGLRLCKGLEKLDISCNPIGRQGIASILQTLNFHSVHRTFNLTDCVFDDASSKHAIDLEFPVGKHSLDLSKPSNRCIVTELYLLASTKRGVKIRSLEYKKGGKNSKKVSIKLRRPENPCHNMGLPYSPYRGERERERHPYTLMEASEWMEVVEKLYLVEESTGCKWDIPMDGLMILDVTCTPQVPTPIECLNATGLRRLVELVQDHPQQCIQILNQCQNIVMETYQLDDMLSKLDGLGLLRHRTEIISNLVGCCADYSNVSGLLYKHLPKLEQIKEIQLLSRHLFYTSTNSFTGHYSLDLENSLDRRTALRLMAISSYENSYIKHATPWGPSHLHTSQQGSRQNFRNETFRNLPLPSGITASFFSQGLRDKMNGVLEFDFVSLTRAESGCEPVGNSGLERALERRGLIHPLTALSSVVLRSRRRALQGTGEEGAGKSVRRGTVHMSSSVTAALQDSQSVVATGIPPPDDLEEVLGPHVQHQANRIHPGGSLPCSESAFYEYFSKASFKCADSIKPESLSLLNSEINKDNSMFFDGNQQMERYLLNLSIRIQSPTSNMFLEPTANLQRLSENGKYSFSGQGKNEDSKMVLNDILTIDNYIDTVKFDFGIISQGGKQMKPTHKKYILMDDMVAVGPEIIVEVKCPQWSMKQIAAKARSVVASFFDCLGVTENHVQLINHKIVDAKTSELMSNVQSFPNALTRVVVHQVDVTIDGLPLNDEIMMKTTSKCTSGYNNMVWRWRQRLSRERAPTKVDLNLSCHEYWGIKTMHLRTLLGGIWISSDQAAFIASRFPQFGNEGHPLRESVIVFLFSRVVDLENFHKVVATLPENNYCGVYRRLGWLNAVNPHEVDYLFNLDLSKADERLMAATLAKFAAVEPGDNMLEPRYRRTFDDIFVFGWDVPASWVIDPDKCKNNDGVPKKGQVIAVYCSSPEMGCKKIQWVRDEFHDRFFFMAVPRAKWNDDFYEHTTADTSWE